MMSMCFSLLAVLLREEGCCVRREKDFGCEAVVTGSSRQAPAGAESDYAFIWITLSLLPIRQQMRMINIGKRNNW
jgi:hypothetical protein